jgi:hypothetical protein
LRSPAGAPGSALKPPGPGRTNWPPPSPDSKRSPAPPADRLPDPATTNHRTASRSGLRRPRTGSNGAAAFRRERRSPAGPPNHSHTTTTRRHTQRRATQELDARSGLALARDLDQVAAGVIEHDRRDRLHLERVLCDLRKLARRARSGGIPELSARRSRNDSSRRLRRPGPRHRDPPRQRGPARLLRDGKGGAEGWDGSEPLRPVET